MLRTGSPLWRWSLGFESAFSDFVGSASVFARAAFGVDTAVFKRRGSETGVRETIGSAKEISSSISVSANKSDFEVGAVAPADSDGNVTSDNNDDSDFFGSAIFEDIAFSGSFNATCLSSGPRLSSPNRDSLSGRGIGAGWVHDPPLQLHPAKRVTTKRMGAQPIRKPDIRPKAANDFERCGKNVGKFLLTANLTIRTSGWIKSETIPPLYHKHRDFAGLTASRQDFLGKTDQFVVTIDQFDFIGASMRRIKPVPSFRNPLQCRALRRFRRTFAISVPCPCRCWERFPQDRAATNNGGKDLRFRRFQ